MASQVCEGAGAISAIAVQHLAENGSSSSRILEGTVKSLQKVMLQCCSKRLSSSVPGLIELKACIYSCVQFPLLALADHAENAGDAWVMQYSWDERWDPRAQSVQSRYLLPEFEVEPRPSAELATPQATELSHAAVLGTMRRAVWANPNQNSASASVSTQ